MEVFRINLIGNSGRSILCISKMYTKRTAEQDHDTAPTSISTSHTEKVFAVGKTVLRPR